MQSLNFRRNRKRGAIILNPFGGGTLVGSIGSVTFQRNRYGNLARSRVYPVNPNTQRQQAVRSAMSVLSAAWRDALTPAKRTAWEDYAAATPYTNKTGGTVFLTGRQMFIRSGFFTLVYVGTLNTDAPVLPGLPAIPTPTFTLTAATGELNLTALANTPTNFTINLLNSTALQPTTNYWKGPFVATATATEASMLPVLLDTLPNPLTAGDKAFVKTTLHDSDTNTLSTFRITEVIAA